MVLLGGHMRIVISKVLGRTLHYPIGSLTNSHAQYSNVCQTVWFHTRKCSRNVKLEENLHKISTVSVDLSRVTNGDS